MRVIKNKKKTKAIKNAHDGDGTEKDDREKGAVF